MQRNIVVDSMRIIGLFLIVLAHISPPETIFQLRTFDVPMMVFVSGMAYYCAGKNETPLYPYIISRFKRLVLPVWSFLILFFLVIYLFKPSYFIEFLTIKIMTTSFLLLSGIGYVWIIRVFLIIAILSPFFVRVIRERSSIYVLSVTVAMLIFSTVLMLLDVQNKMLSHLISEIIIPTFTYGAIFILGYKCISLNKQELRTCLVLFFSLFCILGLWFLSYRGNLPGPQDFKYPPTIYFATYSIFMTYITYFILSYMLREKSRLSDLPNFVSSNTIWIYLWHIPLVEYFRKTNYIDNFLIKYVLVLAISVSITYIQVKLIKSTTNNKMLRAIFTG